MTPEELEKYIPDSFEKSDDVPSYFFDESDYRMWWIDSEELTVYTVGTDALVAQNGEEILIMVTTGPMKIEKKAKLSEVVGRTSGSGFMIEGCCIQLRGRGDEDPLNPTDEVENAIEYIE